MYLSLAITGLALLGLIVAGLAPAGRAFADTAYFECVDQRGRPIFSQQPCGTDAEQHKIVGPPYHSDNGQDAAAQRPPTKAERKAVWSSIETTNRIREIEREIERRESLIDKFESQRVTEQEKLKDQRGNRYSFRYGVFWQENVAAEMHVINQQYQSKIDNERRRVDRLYREKLRLIDDQKNED